MNVKLAGVNAADILMREDQYVSPLKFPYVPGKELVGRTQDGRRVVGITSDGAYAEQAQVYKGLCWEIPEGVTDEQALTLAVDGLSAWHMLHTALRVERYEKVLIPAASSSLGSLALQIAKSHGSLVVAMDRGEDKLQAARDLGADAVVDCSDLDGLPDRIREVAHGPVDVALEVEGGPMFAKTLAALGFRGRMVVDAFSSRKRQCVAQTDAVFGSKTVSGFWLPSFLDNLYAVEKTMQTLFGAVMVDALKTPEPRRYMLEHAQRAHAALEEGQSGKVMLDVDAIHRMPVGYFYGG
ncbi:quinone oxidoreductase family protein [Streptomyces sp. L500]